MLRPYFNQFSVFSGQTDVRLRRRLSDQDKERRLVRRSSSKRKDKENGDKKEDEKAVEMVGAETNFEESSMNLKRTNSVENTGSNNNNNHALLCRTRSEDAASSTSEVGEAGLTRSLPRI